jgi:hypothetical protein
LVGWFLHWLEDKMKVLDDSDISIFLNIPLEFIL